MRTRRKRWAPESPITVEIDDVEVASISPHIASASRYVSAQLGRANDLPSRLAFTSAIAGEGVSYVSMAFAATLAHDTRQRVALVQLNWWNRNEESDETPGLSDVALRGARLDDVVLETSDSCLVVIPSGYANSLDRAMLARDGSLEKLLDVLDSQYDHIVIDLPAVLLTSDSVVLAELADALGLVVRYGVTSFDQVEECVRRLGEDRVSGIVINQEQSRIPRVIRRRLGL